MSIPFHLYSITYFSSPTDVGDAILAIESNLPSSLPSLQRTEDRKQKKKTMEMDLLMRYIQKVTWRVGGIAPVEYDGNVIKGQNPHESKVPYHIPKTIETYYSFVLLLSPT